MVICSDFNANWVIINKNVKLQPFKTVVNAFGLYPAPELYNGDFKYAYSCPNRQVYSWSENIFFPMSLVECGFISCSVHDDATNNSDHVGFASNINFKEISNNNDSYNTNVKRYQSRTVYIWPDYGKVNYVIT